LKPDSPSVLSPDAPASGHSPDPVALWLQGSLGQRFLEDFQSHPEVFRRVNATRLHDPRLAAWSSEAAVLLGLPALPQAMGQAPLAEVFAQGDVPEPLASAYAGHQFGVWAGQLGDGRALLLGDCPTSATQLDWGFARTSPAIALGDRVEIQLKGAGPTPYSRRGDGRAVLRSSIREFLASEALAALGIPTTRALCLFRSEDPVFRESTETAAVVTRLSPSFSRFGHVEFLSHFHHVPALLRFLELTVGRFFPEVLDGSSEGTASPPSDLFARPGPELDEVLLRLLGCVAARTGDLIARWQSVGFCHGVMNTDNMSLLGLTIDYGPYGFLDRYDVDHVCNHSDHTGRYSYANQPAIGAWNCRALAYALRAAMTEEGAARLGTPLVRYREAFELRWRERFLAKFGLGPPGHPPHHGSVGSSPPLSAHHPIASQRGAAGRSEGAGRAQPTGWAGPFGAATPASPENAARAPNHDELLACLESGMHMLQVCKPDFTVFFRSLGAADPFASAPPALLRDQVLDLAAFDAWWAQYQPLAARRCHDAGLDREARKRAMDTVNPCYVLRNHLAEVAIAKARGDHGTCDEGEVHTLLRLLRRPYDAQAGFESYASEAPGWAQELVVSCSS